MKKMIVVLLALCMVLTFVPAFAEGEYAVKGIADGDRFVISQTEASVCNVYVVNAGATGLTPAAPTNLSSADFYVDGELIGSVSEEPFFYPVPVEAGEHSLSVVANTTGGETFEIGTYNYSGTAMINTDDSVTETFDGGAEGADVSFGSMTIAATESCKYQTAPETGSLAMTFSSDVESGQSYFILKAAPVSASKIMTVDYDFYSENSSGNMISHQLRNSSGSAVVPGYTFGTLSASKYTKNTWHHVSYVFDFASLTFRGYLDGYETERGTLNDTANASVRLYLTRYSTGTLYIDNFKACGKVDISDIPETDYAVKGIGDGDRIPVSALPSDCARTISVVDASATARAATAATDLDFAEFYIDGNLAGTCDSDICQWDLPVSDVNEHSLEVKTIDVAGREQNFGPYTYRAVYTVNGQTSFKEYFEGAEGAEITKDSLSTGSRIDTFTSTENPAFAKGPGRDDTAMKLTLASGKSTNLKTKGDILVPETGGFVTYDLDFYSTTGSEYYKIYMHTRNAGGFNMKNGSMTILDNLTMKEVEKNAWHHISYVFDVDNASYCAFLDGYEFDHGAMASNVAGRTVYFQLQTQSYTSGEFYIDNVEILSKTETEAPEMPEDEYDVEITGSSVYKNFLGDGKVIVTVAAGGIDPKAKKVTVGGTELYYVASSDSFVGVVPAYTDEEALKADIEVTDGASDTIVYGKNPAGNLERAVNATDFAIAKKIALRKIANPTAKQLLSFDMAGGAMNGEINAADYMAVKKAALKRD